MYQLAIKLLCLCVLPGYVVSQTVTNIQKFPLKEAKQAVAVDKDHFYVINNSTITKHRKATGEQIAIWDGTKDSVKHLNSGVVIKGKLYCANSNYPQSPMAGSIEIFDVATMTHIGNHSFGDCIRISDLDRSVRWLLVGGFCPLYRKGGYRGKRQPLELPGKICRQLADDRVLDLSAGHHRKVWYQKQFRRRMG